MSVSSTAVTGSCTWTFRPSALSGVHQQAYKTVTPGRLFDLYQEDNLKAQQQQQQQQQHPAGSCAPPPREPNTACKLKLRTCQWNINYFYHARSSISGTMSDDESDDDEDVYVAQEVAQTIIETDADVIVLNEIGIDPAAKQPQSA